MSTEQKAPFKMEVQPGDYFWCACGESEKQPYCDGSHARKNTGMHPVKVMIDSPKTVAWCGCKESKNKPFCDGTHRTLSEVS
ncbi:MAG: glutamate synthase [Omnitrophica bacterium RIFCSPHIGHO2_02_FULL_51_18]|nr:MAG: glutamate synthase [Omnitrophica bacterium RIFCSPHIGHO2_02_FULL_51_18]